MKEEPWHDREEAFLTKIEQQCNDYAAHHTKDHMYYNKLSSRFNIPILVVSSINALTAISLSSFKTALRILTYSCFRNELSEMAVNALMDETTRIGMLNLDDSLL